MDIFFLMASAKVSCGPSTAKFNREQETCDHPSFIHLYKIAPFCLKFLLFLFMTKRLKETIAKQNFNYAEETLREQNVPVLHFRESNTLFNY